MQQLGLHELAEAVLARARRHAGNDLNALVGLMTQFERQNNSDAAAQVAQQILRRSRIQGTLNYVDEAVPRLAIQVLARSGKLPAMITRLEAQLAQAPQSVPIQQTLASYYRVAGQREKLSALSEKTLALRPEDARLRMEVALQLLEAGDTDSACAELTTALTQDPRQYGYFRLELERGFQRQNRLGQLIAVYDAVGLKKLGALSSYVSLLRSLLENPATFAPGLAFYRNLKSVYPTYLWEFLSELAAVDEFWKRPESYDEAVEAMLPAAVADNIYPWLGLGTIRTSTSTSTAADGRVLTVAGRLLDAAAGRGRLDALAARVEEYCGRHPEWTGGKALLGMIRIRQGRAEDARRLLEPIVNPPAPATPTPANLLLEVS